MIKDKPPESLRGAQLRGAHTGAGQPQQLPPGVPLGSSDTMNSAAGDRIVACLLTGPSRGAVATIAVDGQRVGELLDGAFEPAAAGAIRIGQVRYGIWHGPEPSGAAAESVVVSRNPDHAAPLDGDAAGADAQGENGRCAESWEVHCHGGVAAARRILEDLRQLGAAVLTADDWLRWRSVPLLVREAHEVLRRTTSARTAAIALDQVRGAMLRFSAELWQLLAGSERAGGGGVARVSAAAAQQLRFAAIGLHLDQPWRVVLAGPPNVGKSSLINALLGYRRSITLDLPGTTRDVLDAQTIIEGWPVRLSDTAGIHDASHCEIETAGIELARRELAEADLVLWVSDAALAEPGQRIVPPLVARGGDAAPRWLDVINKVDRLDTAPPQRPGCIATSALSGQGIDSLRLAVVAALAGEVPPPGSAVPITQRQVECLQRLAAASDADTARQALAELGGAG